MCLKFPSFIYKIKTMPITFTESCQNRFDGMLKEITLCF